MRGAIFDGGKKKSRPAVPPADGKEVWKNDVKSFSIMRQKKCHRALLISLSDDSYTQGREPSSSLLC